MIELDGSQHHSEEDRLKAIERNDDLKSLGLSVLRFLDFDIMQNSAAVCHETARVVSERRKFPSHLL